MSKKEGATVFVRGGVKVDGNGVEIPEPEVKQEKTDPKKDK